MAAITSKTITLCSTHTSEEVRFFCEDDQILICDDCIVGKHSGHRKIKLKDYVIKKRETIKSKLTDCKNNDIPTLLERINKVTTCKTAFNESVDKQIEKATNRREIIKNIIDELQEGLVQDFEKARNAANEEFDRFINRQTKRVSTFVELQKDLESRVSEKTDVEIIQYDKTLTELLNTDPNYDVVPNIQPPRYQCQEEWVKRGKLQPVVGYIESGIYTTIANETKDDVLPDVKDCVIPNEKDSDFIPEILYTEENKRDFLAVTTFKHAAQVIHIVPKRHMEAWVITTNIEEMDCSSGMVKFKFIKSLGEEPVCAAKTKTSELLIAFPNKKSIKLLKYGGTFGLGIFTRNKSFSLGNFIDTSPLQAVCMCTASKTGDMIVCLVESSHSDFQPVRKASIRRYSSEKSVVLLQEISLAEGQVDIEAPVFISESSRGDICIVCRPDNKSSWIVVVDSTGSMKLRYPKAEVTTSRKIKYDFIGAAFLNDGNITITDREGKKQYLINQQGHCLQVDTHEEQPTCFALGEYDQMWIAFEGGQVKVMTYKNEYSEIKCSFKETIRTEL